MHLDVPDTILDSTPSNIVVSEREELTRVKLG